jgi:asparagine synthase (glutamine-hydrolysing)
MLAKEAIPALRNINHRWLTAGSTLRRDVRLQVEGRDGGNHRWRGGGDPMTEQLRRDHASDILPGLLDYGDAMSMAHGVETRQPFMDYRLVEWGFSKGPAAKIRAGETKWLLRRYLRREGQEEIAARYEKLGYPTPAEEWLLADDAELLRDRVLSEGSRISEYCDIGRMERLVDLARRGLQPVRKSLYRLLVVELWLETTSSHRG